MKKVIINGCFDMLHFGHVKLLEFASKIPFSFVYVLIDSDRRIKELKGQNRPVFNQIERQYILESLRYVDIVEIFDSDQELIAKIKNYEPDIMVKGSDYIGKQIIGKEYCKEVIYYDRIKEYSTTDKIEHIANWGKLY